MGLVGGLPVLRPPPSSSDTPRVGRPPRTSASSPTGTASPTPSAGRRRGRRDAASSADTWQGGSAGKSSSSQPLGVRAAVRGPLIVWRSTTWPPSTRPFSNSTWAAASVACPHRSTSVPGVNHLSEKDPSFRAEMNAVSLSAFSAASACIHDDGGKAPSPSSNTTTAAGLPVNASLPTQNASTCTLHSRPICDQGLSLFVCCWHPERDSEHVLTALPTKWPPSALLCTVRSHSYSFSSSSPGLPRETTSPAQSRPSAPPQTPPSSWTTLA